MSSPTLPKQQTFYAHPFYRVFFWWGFFFSRSCHITAAISDTEGTQTRVVLNVELYRMSTICRSVCLSPPRLHLPQVQFETQESGP